MQLLESWARSLRAVGRSEGTIHAYITDVRGLVEHLDGRDVLDATRGDIEDYLVACRDRGLSDATVARRYRSFVQFFRWLTEEEEIDRNPMSKMKPPKVVDNPPPMPTDSEVSALLAACKSKEKADNGRHGKFERDRDTAIVLVLATTGIRASELIGLHLADVHLDASTFTVTGKGGRTRVLPLLPQAAEAVDRYLRARRRHPHAKTTERLWVGERGPLTDSGLRQLLERRSDDAGIKRINPHAFRHRFAHVAKVRGLSDENLMSLAGWQSPQMLQRYGRVATSERARDAAQALFGDDRL
jgi:site-specific recombinase XerD